MTAREPLATRLARRAERVVRGTRRRRSPLPASHPTDRGPAPSVLSSFRVDRPSRLRMLERTTAHLGEALGGADLEVLVADASPADWRDPVRRAWDSTGLAPRVDPSDLPLVEAYDRLLADASSDVFYLQFDDTITVGLSPGWLDAAATLVRRFDGVVVAPQWPVEVRTGDTSIEVVHHVQRRRTPTQRFWLGGWQEPRAVEMIDGHGFAIFDPFAYGFFFNNLVAPVAAFRERLDWYRRHVDHGSAHAIELAAYRWIGPTWPFHAIPVDIALLDLDYEHTSSAVRGEAPSREVACGLLERGVRPRVVTEDHR